MNRTNIFFGITFIAVGTLFLFDQFGTIDAWAVIGEWWPTLLILAGITRMTTRPRNVVGGSIVAGVGLVLLGWTIGVLDGTGILWPLLLIALGTWLLLGRRTRQRLVAGDDVEIVAIFEGRRDVVRGDFDGGEIVTIFENASLDLTDAAATVDRPVLHVTTIFGDVDLTVPETWDVRVSGPEIFGDVEFRGERARQPETVLRLEVVTIFGDIRIRTSRPSPVPGDATSSAGTHT